MKRLAVLPVAVMLALSAGCTPDAPTAPAVAEIAPPTAAPLVISTAALTDFGAAVEDAAARLLPVLEDQDAAEQLGTHLQALAAHFAAGNRDGAERALGLAQRSLTQHGSTLGDAADLGSIQLVLEGAQALLRGEGAAEQQ